MKNLKHFLLNQTRLVLLTLGLFAITVSLSLGVVVDTESGSSGQQTSSSSTPGYSQSTGGSPGSYEVLPPFQESSQFFPSYPGNAGSVLPTPPTYLNPNAGQQNLPMAPTGQAPYGAPSSSGGATGDPFTGTNPGMLPNNPMNAGETMGTGPMMPAAPTPGQNLNQLGIADPKYGRFESARLEASLMPHQATLTNAARNQIIRGGKPFSGYRQPSAYSPYMSLMRTQDSVRGINNYYEYVMPQIEQQQRNKQVSREINSLESTARSGYEALIQIKQRPGNAPVQSGAMAPATFMNMGGYYGTEQR